MLGNSYLDMKCGFLLNDKNKLFSISLSLTALLKDLRNKKETRGRGWEDDSEYGKKESGMEKDVQTA